MREHIKPLSKQLWTKGLEECQAQLQTQRRFETVAFGSRPGDTVETVKYLANTSIQLSKVSPPGSKRDISYLLSSSKLLAQVIKAREEADKTDDELKRLASELEREIRR